MAKTIKNTTDSPNDGSVVVKVICSDCSPYGSDGQEIDFLESEVQSGIDKGFIKVAKKAKPAIQDDQV